MPKEAPGDRFIPPSEVFSLSRWLVEIRPLYLSQIFTEYTDSVEALRSLLMQTQSGNGLGLQSESKIRFVGSQLQICFI